MRKRKTTKLRVIILCLSGAIFLAFGLGTLFRNSRNHQAHIEALKIDNTDYSKGSGKPVRVIWAKTKKN